MNSPTMQQVLDNPELIRSLIQANPGIRQVYNEQHALFKMIQGCPGVLTVTVGAQLMDSNPDFAQILNNPQMLRESLQVASNPVCS
jgi:hypothetical protein